MLAWGFDDADFERPPVAVWPENRQAVIVFMAMQTQWRTGMNGYTGLDYSALPEVWRVTGTRRTQRKDVFMNLRIIELAALAAMHTKD